MSKNISRYIKKELWNNINSTLWNKVSFQAQDEINDVGVRVIIRFRRLIDQQSGNNPYSKIS